jgi:hypothetical protein
VKHAEGDEPPAVSILEMDCGLSKMTGYACEEVLHFYGIWGIWGTATALVGANSAFHSACGEHLAGEFLRVVGA